MKRLRGKITYANVVSSLCLFLLLGGGAAFAATQLPKNSVGSKQIRKGAISPAKLSPAAVKTLSGQRGPAGAKGAQGAQGAQGAAGPPGAPGSAKAWAEVNHLGGVLRSSGNVAVSRIAVGRYCVSAGPFNNTNSVALATTDWSDEATGRGDTVSVANSSIGFENGSNACPTGQFEVIGLDLEGNDKDVGFVVSIP